MAHFTRAVPHGDQFTEFEKDDSTGAVRIPLTGRAGAGGLFALVDPADVGLVRPFKWHLLMPGRTAYARAQNGALMHRMILDVSERHTFVDHVNHEGLDNRRCNLRIVSDQQNLFNQRPTRNSRSKYKGVFPNGRKWQASYCVNRKRINLGLFDTEEAAAQAYDNAVREIHGEFAYLNFPDEQLDRGGVA